MPQDRELKLVELIYDAASDPASWRAMLEELTVLLSATCQIRKI